MRMLKALAKASDRDVGADELDLHRVFVLGPHGDNRACVALGRFLDEQGYTFPCPGQLLERLPGQRYHAPADVIENYQRWRAATVAV
jgi:hypothetical protein